MGFLLNRSLSRKGIRKVGLGMSITQSVTVSAPGFTPSPSPVSGTNYTVIGPSTGNITLSAGAAEPVTLSIEPKEPEKLVETAVGALADIFITGGGGTGGGAGDLGNAGGGGGGGVVFYPGASLASGVAYQLAARAANPTHFGASPQPMYLVAVRGGAWW